MTTATRYEKESVVGSSALMASFIACFGDRVAIKVETEVNKRFCERIYDVEEKFRDAYENNLDVYLDSFLDDASKMGTFDEGETKDTYGFFSAPGDVPCEAEFKMKALSPDFIVESPVFSVPSSRQQSSFKRCSRQLVFD